MKNEDDNFDWGIIINFKKQNPRDNPTKDATYVVDVLLYVAKGSASKSNPKPKPCPAGEKGEMEVIPVLLPLIDQISSVRIYYPNDLRPADNRMSVRKTIEVISTMICCIVTKIIFKISKCPSHNMSLNVI